MKPQFYKGTTRSLRIAFLGFGVAAFGGIVGVVGYWIGVPLIAAMGFVIVIAGVIIGFVGIARGWIFLLLGKPDPRM
jgi:hypothetical protein